MSESVLRLTGVSKRYNRAGPAGAYQTLRETLATSTAALTRFGGRKREPDDAASRDLWAVRDISFAVAAGDLVGIIGRNGAGKSTLLKLLSRITLPTEGEIAVRGRVGSLLEVGTGFHPELTGRENILLSGAILGMRRADLMRRFDEIVEFAEIAGFLDMAVKHYSSGMYVRLGFAVAAHLETEVLLIDEVLAVGDARFQGKCVAKMLEIGRSGRTILFVSHNLGIVNALCTRAILLRDGRVVEDGNTAGVIARYLESAELQAGVPLAERGDRSGDGRLRFTALQMRDEHDVPIDVALSGQYLRFALSYGAADDVRPENVFAQISVSTMFGQNLFVCLTRATQGNFAELPREGTILCDVPMLPLAPGGYRITITAKVGDELTDEIVDAAQLTVVEGDFFGSGRLPPAASGPILVQHRWSVVGIEATHLRTYRDSTVSAGR